MDNTVNFDVSQWEVKVNGNKIKHVAELAKVIDTS